MSGNVRGNAIFEHAQRLRTSGWTFAEHLRQPCKVRLGVRGLMMLWNRLAAAACSNDGCDSDDSDGGDEGGGGEKGVSAFEKLSLPPPIKRQSNPAVGAKLEPPTVRKQAGPPTNSHDLGLALPVSCGAAGS